LGSTFLNVGYGSQTEPAWTIDDWFDSQVRWLEKEKYLFWTFGKKNQMTFCSQFHFKKMTKFQFRLCSHPITTTKKTKKRMISYSTTQYDSKRPHMQPKTPREKMKLSPDQRRIKQKKSTI